jgi:hypothetical protein
MESVAMPMSLLDLSVGRIPE